MTSCRCNWRRTRERETRVARVTKISCVVSSLMTRATENWIKITERRKTERGVRWWGKRGSRKTKEENRGRVDKEKVTSTESTARGKVLLINNSLTEKRTIIVRPDIPTMYVYGLKIHPCGMQIKKQRRTKMIRIEDYVVGSDSKRRIVTLNRKSLYFFW